MENGVLPVMNVGENNGMGGGWLWIVFLFFLIAWNGGGMFGGNGASNAISNDFLYTNLKNTMDMGFNQVANQGFQTQRDVANGVAGLSTAINNVGFQAQQCCCETNRNIDGVKYSQLQGDSAIMANDTANTQKILDRLCAMESNAKDQTIAQLRQDLQAAQLTLGNAAQTTNIVSALMPPRPVPAYQVAYPYTCAYAQA